MTWRPHEANHRPRAADESRGAVTFGARRRSLDWSARRTPKAVAGFGRTHLRCGAKLHGKLAACRRWPVPGRTRCRLHGGMSTGAMTPEGKARVLAALIEGRQRWLEEIQRAKKAGLIARFPPRQEVGRPVGDPSDAGR